MNHHLLFFYSQRSQRQKGGAPPLIARGGHPLYQVTTPWCFTRSCDQVPTGGGNPPMIRVLDTSVLVYDPDVFDAYPGDDLVIPLTVIRELDGMKSRSGHPGPSARAAIARLDDLREHGRLDQGVPRECGGVVSVEMNHINSRDLLPANAEVETSDDRINLAALNLSHENNGNVVLMTQDRSMGLLAEAWGVTCVRHTVADNVPLESVVSCAPTGNEISDIYSHGTVITGHDLAVNTGVILSSGSSSALAISDGDGGLDLVSDESLYGGLSPRGAHQKIAAHLLLGGHMGSKSTEFLGSLSGRAGSGKTLCAVAAGLMRLSEGDYDRIMIFRPTEPVGRDLGFLPGSLDEKMSPWSAAIGDVLHALHIDMDAQNCTIRTRNGRHVPLADILSVESVNHVRGRTFARTFVIIDEAQNLEPTVLRTVLSRLGEGSAAVMTWDPSQIDNPFLRKSDSAPYTLLSGIMPNQSVWHVELPNAERGGVSALIG